MEKTILPRLLNADEMEVRVKTWDKSFHKWAMMLIYKDARCDMRILDEIYGTDGWQREHQEIGGRLYCTISVWSERLNQWVKKQDVGTESDTEKEKGQASDSFKRAGFNCGIGRELYTAPKIFIKTTDADYKNSKFATPLEVTHVAYNEKREISELTICDNNGVIRFDWKANSKPSSKPAPKTEDPNLELALQQVREANDMLTLEQVYRSWGAYARDYLFINACSKRKAELNK